MLQKTFESRTESRNISHSAFCQPSFLFDHISVFKSCEGTPHLMETESPGLFSDTNKDLIDVMESTKHLSTRRMKIVRISKICYKSGKMLQRKQFWAQSQNLEKQFFFLHDVSGKRRSLVLCKRFPKRLPMGSKLRQETYLCFSDNC